MDSLNEDQRIVFDSYLNNENIMITGAGGCGKSHIIKVIVNDARKKNKNVEVTALTGCAAVLLNCGAKTIHSWGGIGLGITMYRNIDKIIRNIYYDKNKKERWLNTDILIIDEVSMMSVELFELLDSIGKRIRRNKNPFGGIQIIFSGDFYQLCPIGNNDRIDSGKYCFESERWNDSFDCQILLNNSYRHNDEQLVNILKEIREGNVSKKTSKILRSRIIDIENIKPNVINGNHKTYPIHLMAKKKDVERINEYYLNKIEFGCHSFKYIVKKSEKIVDDNNEIVNNNQIDNEIKYLLSNSLIEEELKLKIGSQVMCISNLDIENGICNGSTGIIVGFTDIGPKVKFNNMELIISRQVWKSDLYKNLSIEQYPLILAWSVTIHKCQGATIDKGYLDIGNTIFTEGQTYVALSRIRNIDGIYLKSFDPSKVKANVKVKEYYDIFK